jgi:arsenite methyltransferase
MEEVQEVREAVRNRYAELAIVATTGSASCCGDGKDACFGSIAYDEAELAGLPDAVAELSEGEVVLDLGSGGGIDVLLSAKRVGPAGKAFGLDMTDEMLDLARKNASESGATNVEFLKGHIEDIPLPGESVDVIISNCVINLSADKAKVLSEAARVLRPGGRFAVSDVIADDDMDEATRRDMQQWTGCIAGALSRKEFSELLISVGLEEVEIVETHRVHASAGSAIIRARKPSDGELQS